MSFQAFLADNGLGTGLHVESKEVFSVVSDVEPSVSWALPTEEVSKPMLIVLGAVVSRAPWLVIFQFMGEMWALVALILNLSFGHTGLCMIEEAVIAREVSEENLHALLLVAYSLIFVNIPMLILQHSREDVARKISGHIRAHFYPLVAQEMLFNDRQSCHPISQDFTDIFRLDFLGRMFQIVRGYLTIICAFATLSFIALLSERPDQWLLLSVLLQFPYAIFKVIRSTGFNILTDDASFLRLCGLHTMIFDPKYAFNLAKDGVKEMTVAEYTQASHVVGPVSYSYSSLIFSSRTNNLQFIVDILVGYWQLLILMTPLYEIFTFRLSTILFSLYAVFILRPLLESASLAFINGTLTENLTDARTLVSSTTLGHVFLPPTSTSKDRAPFDREYLGTKEVGHQHLDLPAAKVTSSLKEWLRVPVYSGMKLAYNNVTIESEVIVQNASFEISPGMLVLVVGGKGSGKTALVESLLGLSPPASGAILVDDMPLMFSNPKFIQLHRDYTTFLTQHREKIYPLSAKENISWGHNSIHHFLIAEMAGIAAGCSRTSAAMDVVRPMLEKKFSVQVTPVQEQRLIAARMLYRLYQRYTRLLVLDEPVNMLGADAEYEVIDQFLAAREGITTIIVSKRFKKLAIIADMILCMDNGRIVQRGSHTELIHDEQGTYARLYNTL